MIVNSLLDTDFYKLTMMQTVLHHFPAASVEYRFKCRTPDVDLRPYAAEIQKEIDHLCSLRFTPDELEYLSKIPYLKPDFIHFLRIFQLSNEFITITADTTFELVIKGPWLHTILFEAPLLAIISEVYMRNQYANPAYETGKQRLQENINLVKSNPQLTHFLFSDFGTRRRFSFAWHKEVLAMLNQELPNNLRGTSNVYFAKLFGLTPIGTMAHEYIQACQAVGPRLRDSQKYAFEIWAKEYRGNLGIALSDTYGLDPFLQDFDLYLCKLFDGARQDSGDPFIWGDRLIEHYTKKRIDPKTKRLVFSDNLNFPLAIKLYHYFKDRTNPTFGIGTQLTNNLGHQPIQIVIKMTECNGQPVAKISDAPDKIMCKDPSYLAYLKQVFGIKEEAPS